MARAPIYDSKQIEEALRKCRGNMSAAARLLKMTRRGVAKRVHDEPELQEALAEARNILVDDAEQHLYTILDNPRHPRHLDVINRVLDAHGADRGWGNQGQLRARIKELEEELARLKGVRHSSQEQISDEALNARMRALGLEVDHE